MNSLVATPPQSQAPATLASLATKANRAHAACEKAVRSALEHARLCGQALSAAKEIAPFGTFEGWITKHCKFSPRMARRYMTIANGWTKILDLSKRTRASDLPLDSLSVREALRILSVGGPEDESHRFLDTTCPSCGERLVVTSKLYATCESCRNCRLYRVPMTSAGKYSRYSVPRDSLKTCAALSISRLPTAEKGAAILNLLAYAEAPVRKWISEQLGEGNIGRLAATKIKELAATLQPAEPVTAEARA